MAGEGFRRGAYGSASWLSFEGALAARLIHLDKYPETQHGLFIGSWWRKPNEAYAVRYRGDSHQLIVAGIGGGKFTTALAPMLMTPNSVERAAVIIDPKGELAAITGAVHQQQAGDRRRVHLLDPFDLCGTGQGSALNVLSILKPDSPTIIDDARRLADGLIVTSSTTESHFDDTARNFTAALLVHVATDPSEHGRRDLRRVRELVGVAMSEKGKKFLGYMADSEAYGGFLARAAGAMLGRKDKERSGILSSIERDTFWLESELMAAVVKDGIDLQEAAFSDARFYVCLEPDLMKETHKGWLRILIAAFSLAFKRGMIADDPRGKYHTFRHIVIDEFPALGKMSFVENDIAVGRGYGIKYTLAVQNFNQLKGTYGADAWENFISGCFIRAFAVDDNFTAEYLSKMMGNFTDQFKTWDTTDTSGTTTTFTQTSGISEGKSATGDPTSSSSQGTSYATATAKSTAIASKTTNLARALLFPDEVRLIHENAQLIIMRGLPPILCGREPFWLLSNMIPQVTRPLALLLRGSSPKRGAIPTQTLRLPLPIVNTTFDGDWSSDDEWENS